MGGYVARQKREAAQYDRMGPAAKGTSCAPAKLTYLGTFIVCQTHTTRKLTNPFDFFFLSAKQSTETILLQCLWGIPTHKHVKFQIRVLFMIIAAKQTGVFMGPVPQRSSSHTQRGQDVNEEGVLARLHH